MKIALILSGQPRFYNSVSYTTIYNEILNKYDTDVFFHCWYSSNKDYNYEYSPWSGINQKITFPDTVKEDLIKMYNPKEYIIEEPIKFNFKMSDIDNNNKNREFLYNNVPSMFYSLTKSNELRITYEKKNNIIYDWVIRARFDTLLVSLPELNKLCPGNIYVPDNCPNPNVFNDNFSICSSLCCNNIYDVFTNLQEYINKVGIIPESIWKCHIELLSINVVKLNFFQNFSRSNFLK